MSVYPSRTNDIQQRAIERICSVALCCIMNGGYLNATAPFGLIVTVRRLYCKEVL